jgi:hypothetical protein
MNRYKKIFQLFIFLFLIACENSFLKWDLPRLASVETTDLIKISNSSVQCNGNVTNDGGSSVKERGICYGTYHNPSADSNKVVSGSGKGAFSAIIEGLLPNTNYYFRGYVINKTGVSYGNELSLKTGALPELTTVPVTSITTTTAICGGNITNGGSSEITDRGICYSTSSNPTINNNKVSSGNGTGSFNATMDGLTSGTTYHVRAYATNSSGTSYGNDVSFTTATLTLPFATTTAASSITLNSAISGGEVTNEGGSSVTERGICYSTSANPTLTDNKISSGNGKGSFTANISGLTQSTTYHVRAYAVNTTGTAYGNDISFTTNSLLLPTVTTTAVSSITNNSAVSGGNVTSDGGGSVTERGICYTITSNPTTAGNKIPSGTGTGNFTSSMSGLNQGTTYYVRAYAINSAGTSYGNEVSFTTNSISLPSVSTASASSITINSAVSGGNITNDGGSTVTERGVCYSTSANPTVSNSKIVSGNGTGTFTSNITGLTPGTTYFIRAYAVNSAGTAYGNEVSFTTKAIQPPTVSTSPATSITNNSAVTGGEVRDDGGGSVSERGICFSTSPAPVVTDNKVTGGSGTGVFVSTISGLSLGTTYYVRAYAINQAGAAYGNEISFKTSSVLTIGLNYGGGIIFYLDNTKNHGLIAAPSDQSTNAKWGCSDTSIPGAANTSAGSGMVNTLAIIGKCNETGIAAQLCYNLKIGSYEDWYLPSKDELNLLYTNLKAKGLGDFSSEDYWSSSQESAKNSWLQSFSSGKQSSKNKNTSMSVRAIRSF